MDECLRCSGKLFIVPATDIRKVFFINQEINIRFDIYICKVCGYSDFKIQEKYLDKMKEISR